MEKYNIGRKADSIALSVLIHDLICYKEDLEEPATDHVSLTRKLRHTRNVFISLYNVKDVLNTIQVKSDEELLARTKKLRNDLEFVVHVRNKGVGHLDKELLRRAAQWEPHIFHEDSKDQSEFATMLCYKALLETSINSYQTGRLGKKPFSSEIDLMYPQNAKEFFSFLSRIIQESISWLTEVRDLVNTEIEYHSSERLFELSTLAGQTSFDLKGPPEVDANLTMMQDQIRQMLERLREEGTDEELAAKLEEIIIKWEQGKAAGPAKSDPAE